MYVFCSQLCSSGDAKNKMCDLFSTKNTSSFQQAFREGAVQLPVAGVVVCPLTLAVPFKGR